MALSTGNGPTQENLRPASMPVPAPSPAVQAVQAFERTPPLSVAVSTSERALRGF